MNKKVNKYPNCKECAAGFVELKESNWACVSLLEKYVVQIFFNGMGAINTEAIKNVLEAEGYTGDEYSKLFHDFVIFLTTAISQNND